MKSNQVNDFIQIKKMNLQLHQANRNFKMILLFLLGMLRVPHQYHCCYCCHQHHFTFIFKKNCYCQDTGFWFILKWRISREKDYNQIRKKAFSIFMGKVTLKKSPRNILRVMKISTLNLYIIHVTCILRAVYSKFQTLVKVILRFQGS